MGGRSSVVDGTVERVGNGTVKIRLLCTALRTSERASEEGRAMSAHPSKSHPSIHCLVHSPLPEIAGWDGQPASAKSISLLLSLQVQTNLGSTNKSFVHPSAQWKLGSVAMPWMDVRLFGCSAPSFVCGVPRSSLSSCAFRCVRVFMANIRPL